MKQRIASDRMIQEDLREGVKNNYRKDEKYLYIFQDLGNYASTERETTQSQPTKNYENGREGNQQHHQKELND